jgi:hypothetical protein
MKFAHAIACAIVCVAATSGAAEKAQKPLNEILRGAALDAYLKGRDLFEAGDVVTGHAKLVEAYETSKNPRLLWNMAACSKSSRNYARAIDELTRFLADGRDQITADQAKRAEEVRATLYSLVAAATITRAPEDATLAIDGEPATRGAGPYYLELGKHELRLEREGFAPEVRTIDVKQTKALTLELTLERIPTAPAPLAVAPAAPSPTSAQAAAPAATVAVAPAATAQAEPSPSGESSHAWTYAAFGVGAAGVVAGATFGLLAMGAASDLEAACPGRVCPASQREALDDAKLFASLSTAGWVVGAVGLAAGTALVFTGPSTSTAFVLSPAGASLRGAF